MTNTQPIIRYCKAVPLRLLFLGTQSQDTIIEWIMQEIMSIFMFQLTTHEDIVNQNCSAYMLDFFDIT